MWGERRDRGDAGSACVEFGSLSGADRLLSGPLTVVCGHGERAMTGASLRTSAGRGDLAVLIGGPDDWANLTGAPLERGLR